MGQYLIITTLLSMNGLMLGVHATCNSLEDAALVHLLVDCKNSGNHVFLFMSYFRYNFK